MSRTEWTPEALALLAQRLAEKVPVRLIAEELGRNRSTVRAKISYMKGSFKGRPGAGNVTPVYAPDHVMEERDRVINGQRTLTGVMFGDPLPGRSALDRRARA